MKWSVLFIAILSLTASCKKCYKCTTDLPVYFNGQQVGTTEYSEYFCENVFKAKPRVESYEDEGYTCLKTD